jgi:cell division protein FtsL
LVLPLIEKTAYILHTTIVLIMSIVLINFMQASLAEADKITLEVAKIIKDDFLKSDFEQNNIEFRNVAL